MLETGWKWKILSFARRRFVFEILMFECRGRVDPLERVEGDKFPKKIEEIVTRGSENVSQRSSWVGLELDVVRQLSEARPRLLGGRSQGQEDLREGSI